MTSQPDPVTFFLDRCLGCYDVPRAMNEAAILTELHKHHFNSDTPDARAAKRAGVSVSEWMRDRLAKAARRESK